MRIAIYQNLPSGGAKRALLEWAKRLAVAHEIDVIALSEADHEFCDLRPYVREYLVFDYVPRGLFKSPFGRLNQLQRWRDLGTLQEIGVQIAERLNSGSYDVVFANPCQRTLIPTFLQFMRIPVVYYLHEPFGPSFKRKITRPYLKTSSWREWSRQIDPFIRMYHQRLEEIRHKGIDHTYRLLSNSGFTQAQIRLDYGVEAPVCRCGVNTADFRPLSCITKEAHVLSVGELTPRKGFDFLIESLAQISENKRPPLRLVSNWIDPTERIYLEALAAENHVRLEILFRLNAQQLAVEYNKAILCVYSPVAEPLGLVPLEAMACGTPVVGVAEAGVCETVRHDETGLLVERNVLPFADAVVRLLENESLRAQFAIEGPKYIERDWSWSQSTTGIESHLMEAAGAGYQEPS